MARPHLDLEVDPGGIPDATARATALGAVAVGALQVDDQGRFEVMTDPEGNEFCCVSD